MKHLRKTIRTLIAMFRLNKRIVCEESVDRPPWRDFHDYTDSTTPYPFHMFPHKCKRCGKYFTI